MNNTSLNIDSSGKEIIRTDIIPESIHPVLKREFSYIENKTIIITLDINKIERQMFNYEFNKKHEHC